MKKAGKILTLLVMGTLLMGCQSSSEFYGDNYFIYDDISFKNSYGPSQNNESWQPLKDIKKPTQKLRDDFAFGVDVSTINQTLELGGVFYNLEGNEQNVFQILKNAGCNFVRLKLFNDPFTSKGYSYGAGSNDLSTDLAIAKEAKKVGINILIDFHYSDFWADPGHQTCPKAWQNSQDILKDIYQFTYDSLMSFKKNKIRVDAVQIGNEIHNGMMWPYFNIDYHKEASYENLTKAINQGYRASKDVFTNIKTIIHVANAHEKIAFNRFFEMMDKYQAKYDIVGVSCYPYWHGDVSNLINNLNEVCSLYDKAGMVMETSYAHTFDYVDNANQIFGQSDYDKMSGKKYDPTPQGQADLISDVINGLSNMDNNHGLGMFYWEPAWLPVKGNDAGNQHGENYQKGAPELTNNEVGVWKNSWANQGLFSFTGKALPSLETYKLIKA